MTNTPTKRAVPATFWLQIDHQLERIEHEKPDTFDAVREILLDPAYDKIVTDVNLNGQRNFDLNSAFFAGSGGDRTLHSALRKAGWHTQTHNAAYHYVLMHENTAAVLTYVEGDVLRGDRIL